jgi:hypothetical protein
MRATTPNVRNRVGKYAAILDGLMHDNVKRSAVAARIEEMGGIDAAYEAMQARRRRRMRTRTRDEDDKPR